MVNDIELTDATKRRLRFCKIFKTASAVAYDDIFAQPWKIPICMTPTPFFLGTLTLAATFAYYAMSKSDKAVQARADIARAMEQAPRPRVYKNFMTASSKEPTKFEMSSLQMARYMWAWHKKYIASKYALTMIMRDSQYHKATV